MVAGIKTREPCSWVKRVHEAQPEGHGVPRPAIQPPGCVEELVSQPDSAGAPRLI